MSAEEIADPRRRTGESAGHHELKRLALVWAQSNGFRIAAAEVSLPNYRVRMDVAAYRPERVREASPKTARLVWRPRIGVAAIFECKVSMIDFRRDARSLNATLERLKVLHEKKERIEQELRIFYPSIRNGDSLFQEYETLDFERPGYERYEAVIAEIRQLSARLHGNTKFDRLRKCGAANLHYLVVEPGVVLPHELPAGWGLLQRIANRLELLVRPFWHEVSEDERLAFLQRVSMAGTRAVNREHGVNFDDLHGASQSSPIAS